MFNNSPVGIIFVSEDYNIIDANLASTKFFNQERSSNIKGSNILENLSLNEQENLKKLCQNIKPDNKNSQSADIHLNTQKPDLITTIYAIKLQRFYAADNEIIKGYVLYLIDATQQRSLEV